MKTRTIAGAVVACVFITCTGLLYMYQEILPGNPASAPPRANASGHEAARAYDYTDILGQKTFHMHCNICTLVTSSGQLTGSQCGAEIDRAECVIRMNDAPIRGYEQDVGRRTSLRVVAHSSVQQVLRNRHELFNDRQDTVLLVWGPERSMRRDGKGWVYNHLHRVSVSPKLQMFQVSPLKMQWFDELFRTETGMDRVRSNTWLSTGWFTMAIAMEICDRINVYGMVPPDFCTSPRALRKPYHYYQLSGPSECDMYLTHERTRHGGRHRFFKEKYVFAHWAQTHDIHFYQPEWKH
ncbi:alpha-N-acetylgalactosaminide alpha-2,6-sialyltransferase 5b [Electrophorus electricus]|uniref:alpha-N-acetylgalactosaminide alpha-2,6-sialyltransferase 5b n=1 Tax=Electrophorus electricus TaxID=8005 RepID=UPI0015CFE9B3|nr:alpha-N-acetylgalactosaminide alpha-2,6-sialyltransferase 5b [Electrophorus electricus]